jgi:hypothetical protein
MATRTQTARHTRMVTRQSQRDAENEADAGVADEGDSASETEQRPDQADDEGPNDEDVDDGNAGQEDTQPGEAAQRAPSARVHATSAGDAPSTAMMAALVGRMAAIEARLAAPVREPRHAQRLGSHGAARRPATAPPPSDPSSDSSPSGTDDDDDIDPGRRGARPPDGDPDADDDEESASSSDSEEETEEPRQRRAPRGRPERGRRGRQGRRGAEQPRRRSVKDLELPSFTPSPKVSVATWIDRVDLALRGAKESGRGTWTDASLYYILGNKLMDNAARWWVNINRKLDERGRTWTNLKKMLLRRYAEKLDKSTAEWRVNMRRMMPGETYADFAAGLRDVVGRNRVSERVLLAQFYRCLDKTTKKLVRQSPKPRSLEEAVDKATEIDDPMDNVAQGMMNVGLPWATAPNPYVVAMAGTTGQTMVIPGIGGAGLPFEVTGSAEGMDGGMVPTTDPAHLALFTNPQGIYNVYSGTWDTPPGYTWNGKYWTRVKSNDRTRNTVDGNRRAETKKPAGKPRVRKDVEVSGDESDAPSRRKRMKAAVRQTTADDGRDSTPAGRTGPTAGTGVDQAGRMVCFRCGQSGHWAHHCTSAPVCYACSKPGHLARDCPNAKAKSRNDAFLKQRGQAPKAPAENEERAR